MYSTSDRQFFCHRIWHRLIFRSGWEREERCKIYAILYSFRSTITPNYMHRRREGREGREGRELRGRERGRDREGERREKRAQRPCLPSGPLCMDGDRSVTINNGRIELRILWAVFGRECLVRDVLSPSSADQILSLCSYG